VPLPIPVHPDALRPTAEVALAAWSARVAADREQVERCREVEDPADFYAPVADRFRHDPNRPDDAVLDRLRELARAGDTWLDIGAGGGRYALPIAQVVREVVAVDPSPGMLAVLGEGMRRHAIPNIRAVTGRWPLAGYHASCDVALMAHVGYDIAALGPFLDAMEDAATRACVAVLAEGAMTTVATLYWEPIHGEPRVRLPALPEFLAVLMARGTLFELSLALREPVAFESADDLLSMARRQLWVRPGSARDDHLRDLVRQAATQRDGLWALDWSTSRIGVVNWQAGQGIRAT
jgi:SAM-dependent methyltransferase